MAWTAIVPWKSGPLRKSRLSPALDARQRTALSEELYRHVVGRIAAAGFLEEIIVLAPSLPDTAIEVRLWVQAGEGINAELARIRDSLAGPLMVVNADLPLLETSDLIALAGAAENEGCALAADRHGLGTNAIALLPRLPFTFAFGPDSLDAHLRSAPEGTQIVRRTGLAYDIDTVEDIEAVLGLSRPLAAGIRSCLSRGQGSV